MDKIHVSNCCGAEMDGVVEDMGICPDCKEHCSIEELEEETETVMGLTAPKKLIDKYWNQRENKPLEKVNFKGVKTIKSLI